MEKYRKSAHTVYDLKYHFVWCPKYRYSVLEGDLRERLKELIGHVCESMNILLVEGDICEDHVNLCLSVPPRYAPSEVMKAIKGKTAEKIFREFPRLRKKYWGQHSWARGYFVSTVGIDEETIKAYIRNQEYINSKEQMKFWK